MIQPFSDGGETPPDVGAPQLAVADAQPNQSDNPLRMPEAFLQGIGANQAHVIAPFALVDATQSTLSRPEEILSVSDPSFLRLDGPTLRSGQSEHVKWAPDGP